MFFQTWLPRLWKVSSDQTLRHHTTAHLLSDLKKWRVYRIVKLGPGGVGDFDGFEGDILGMILGGFDYIFDFLRCCVTKLLNNFFRWCWFHLACFHPILRPKIPKKKKKTWNHKPMSRASGPRFGGVLHSWWRVQTSSRSHPPRKHTAFAVYILTVLATSPNGTDIRTGCLGFSSKRFPGAQLSEFLRHDGLWKLDYVPCWVMLDPFG